MYVSAKVAAVVGDKSTCIKHLAFDKEYYKKMIISYLEQFGEASREDLDELLMEKISDALSSSQKSNKIKNLLQDMRKAGLIQKAGSGAGRASKWALSK